MFRKLPITEFRRRALALVRLVLLFTGVAAIAWLSQRFSFSVDVTASARNSLSETSKELLSRLDQPIVFRMFVNDEAPARARILAFLGAYQRIGPGIEIQLLDPADIVGQTDQPQSRAEGQLTIQYGDRRQTISNISEQQISNTLALLSRNSERWIVFLSGHGERDPAGQANHDLGLWGNAIGQSGLKARAINLAYTGAIPDNTAVLVIADPRIALLPGELDLILQYLEAGGNLLWLVEPGGLAGLESLARHLAVKLGEGTIVNPENRLVDNPAFTMITDYARHPVTDGFQYVTLLPQARAIEADGAGDWQVTRLLRSDRNSWMEPGEVTPNPTFDPREDIAGPHDVGVILSRSRARPGAPTSNDREAGAEPQKVVIIGDSDFLSNAYLANGGNLQLGLNIMNWLAGDEQLINIPGRTAPDAALNLSHRASSAIGLGFLILLPLMLAVTGLFVWYRRRRRTPDA